MEKENETIETITKSYEEKIANREKEILEEKRKMKEDYEKQIKDEKEKHQKDIADIILGRQQSEKVQEKEKGKEHDEDTEKSFFDKAVEDTKKILKGGK